MRSFVSQLQWRAEGSGERDDGPGHPMQGTSKERNYKN